MINTCHEGQQKDVAMQEPFMESSKAMQSPGDENILPSQPEDHMVHLLQLFILTFFYQ